MHKASLSWMYQCTKLYTKIQKKTERCFFFVCLILFKELIPQCSSSTPTVGKELILILERRGTKNFWFRNDIL